MKINVGNRPDGVKWMRIVVGNTFLQLEEDDDPFEVVSNLRKFADYLESGLQEITGAKEPVTNTLDIETYREGARVCLTLGSHAVRLVQDQAREDVIHQLERFVANLRGAPPAPESPLLIVGRLADEGPTPEQRKAQWRFVAATLLMAQANLREGFERRMLDAAVVIAQANERT